jgi:hypothetical protein
MPLSSACGFSRIWTEPDRAGTVMCGRTQFRTADLIDAAAPSFLVAGSRTQVGKPSSLSATP